MPGKLTHELRIAAHRTICNTQSASVASLQRQLKLGYATSVALLRHFEDEWVSPQKLDGWHDILPRVLDRTHTQHRHPINSYWAMPGHLLAGEYPGTRDAESTRQKLHTYLDAGVDAFLDLTEEGELRPYQNDLDVVARALGKEVHYKRQSIEDVQTPETPQQMKDILSTLDQWQREGRTVYVHCWGGVGRTGTVIGCHLVEQGMPASAALRHLALLWTRMSPIKQHWHPRSPETDEQRFYVQGWHHMSSMKGL